MSNPYQIVDLDVRPYLRKKLEPFKVIMETVQNLKEDEWLRLHATFKPTPLLGVMRGKGYVNNVEKIDAEHWIVTFAPKKWAKELGQIEETSDHDEADLSAHDHDHDHHHHHHHHSAESAEEDMDVSNKEVSEASSEPQTYQLDNRGLEPPQPMVRTLGRLDKMNAGDLLIIHNDRVPVFLVEELNQLGYAYDIEEQTDGSAKVKITKTVSKN